jgi:hypothetical protein
VVEENYAVRNVFIESVASQHTFAAFPRDHRRNALVLEPAEQTPQLRTQYSGIGKAREKSFGGIEQNAFGLDLIDRRVQADE